jgi:hypothetical protein
MGQISTPFISYQNTNVEEIDLIEDAWGLTSEFSDVIDLFRQVRVVPDELTSERMIENIMSKI